MLGENAQQTGIYRTGDLHIALENYKELNVSFA